MAVVGLTSKAVSVTAFVLNLSLHARALCTAGTHCACSWDRKRGHWWAELLLWPALLSIALVLFKMG